MTQLGLHCLPGGDATRSASTADRLKWTRGTKRFLRDGLAPLQLWDGLHGGPDGSGDVNQPAQGDPECTARAPGFHPELYGGATVDLFARVQKASAQARKADATPNPLLSAPTHVERSTALLILCRRSQT